ncbi:MAG: rhomboid family intramembrane serine protease [Planctomycetia bacterium]|nr:rhomboid family intramembrane serine protease [Planctomycetia bacterium]
MGIHDRDYYREATRGAYLNTHSAVTGLIVANVAIFLANFFAGNWLNQHLSLGANVFTTFRVWELVTHGFLHGGFLHLLFNMLVLGFFGPEVETIYGRKRFLQLYFSLIPLAGLCWAVTEYFGMQNPHAHAIGASGAIAGVLLVYVLHYPMRMIMVWGIFPVPAWLLATIWIGQDVVMLAHNLQDAQSVSAEGGHVEAKVAFAAHIGGALFGLIFFKTGRTLADLIPLWRVRNPLKGISRPKLRVIEPDDDEDELEQEVDRILAKISEEGSDSLTPMERSTLKRASELAKRKQRLRH